MKTSTNLEQCRNSTIGDDASVGWARDSRYHLQQRALTGAVSTDEPEGLSASEIERDIPQRVKILASGTRRTTADPTRGSGYDVREALDEYATTCCSAESVALAHVFDAESNARFCRRSASTHD